MDHIMSLCFYYIVCALHIILHIHCQVYSTYFIFNRFTFPTVLVVYENFIEMLIGMFMHLYIFF